MNTLESFQDNGNLWLTIGKKGKILHDEETRANQLQRKQPRSKKFELALFGDTDTKRIDPSFIASCDKLALNYSSVGGCQGARSIQTDTDFQRKSSRSCCNKSNNPCRHKSPSQRPPKRHNNENK